MAERMSRGSGHCADAAFDGGGGAAASPECCPVESGG